MIYASQKQGPMMAGYVRASTSNPLGWRPGTVNLGYMSSAHQNGPDWKAVTAQRDAAIRAQQRHSDARYRASMARMHAVDSAARGDRTRVRTPRLSGMGALSSAASMVRGAQYTFHFSISSSFWGGNIDENSLRSTIARDTNFSGVSVLKEPTGFRVNFTWTQEPASVAGASSEMQNIINAAVFNGLGLTGSAVFVYAEGGPAVLPGSSGTQVFVGTDGILRDASGNVISQNVAPPPSDQNNNNDGGDGSPFDWTSFWEGMGLSVGVGTALTVGLAILIFKR